MTALLLSLVFLAPAADPAGVLPVGADGKPLNLDFETGTLKDWTAEGEAFKDQPIKGDTVHPRRGDMKSNHQGDYWIGGYEKLRRQADGHTHERAVQGDASRGRVSSSAAGRTRRRPAWNCATTTPRRPSSPRVRSGIRRTMRRVVVDLWRRYHGARKFRSASSTSTRDTGGTSTSTTSASTPRSRISRQCPPGQRWRRTITSTRARSPRTRRRT